MQTFLPYADFTKTAQSLDNQRLVKQLLECRQIFAALSGNSRGWVNHPATLMWKDSPQSLYRYVQAMITENQARGYETTANAQAIDAMYRVMDPGAPQPWWMNDADILRKITRTHRASLYRKRPDLYLDFEVDNPGYEADVCCPVKYKTAQGKVRGVCSYYWPTHDEEAMNEALDKMLVHV